MHTTDPTQTTPPPSPDAASHPPDPTLVLPSSIYYQIVHTLGGLLPAPVTDTPEALAHRDNDAIAHVASLLPGNADEAHLAARVAAADAYAMDCLRLAHDCRVAPMLFLKCTAQAACMMREARGARTQLMRIQAERRKRESDNATRDQAAWTEHCAIGLMMQALPGAAPVAMPDPPPPPPAPEPPPADEPRTDLAAEADLYAIMYPRRAVRIRALGGLPQPLDFGAPSGGAAAGHHRRRQSRPARARRGDRGLKRFRNHGCTDVHGWQRRLLNHQPPGSTYRGHSVFNSRLTPSSSPRGRREFQFRAGIAVARCARVRRPAWHPCSSVVPYKPSAFPSQPAPQRLTGSDTRRR